MSKKKIIAIVLFIFIGFFMFTYASPEKELSPGETNTPETQENENTKQSTFLE